MSPGIGAVDVVVGETERVVQPRGRTLSWSTYSIAVGHASLEQEVEAGEHELLPESAPLEVRVDGDDVDLAELAAPASASSSARGPSSSKSRQVSPYVVQEEAARVEPVLALALRDRGEVQSPARDGRETPGC